MNKKLLVKKLVCLAAAGAAVYAVVKYGDKLGLTKAVDKLPAPVKDNADKVAKAVVSQTDKITDQVKDTLKK